MERKNASEVYKMSRFVCFKTKEGRLTLSDKMGSSSKCGHTVRPCCPSFALLNPFIVFLFLCAPFFQVIPNLSDKIQRTFSIVPVVPLPVHH